MDTAPVPDYTITEVKNRLDKELLKVVEQFNTKYSLSYRSSRNLESRKYFYRAPLLIR
jgi:hypothetical protein